MTTTPVRLPATDALSLAAAALTAIARWATIRDGELEVEWTAYYSDPHRPFYVAAVTATVRTTGSIF